MNNRHTIPALPMNSFFAISSLHFFRGQLNLLAKMFERNPLIQVFIVMPEESTPGKNRTHMEGVRFFDRWRTAMSLSDLG
jgi:hypothetical protein